MNPLEPIAHLIDPVEKYFRRSDKRACGSAGRRPPPGMESLPGSWVEVAGWNDDEGIARASAELVERAAVRIRMPHGMLAAKMLRFWTGSGVLDILSTRDDRVWGGSISRIERAQFKDLRPLVDGYLAFAIAGMDPTAPDEAMQ